MKTRWRTVMVLLALVVRVDCDIFGELLLSVQKLHDKVDNIGLEQIKTNEKVLQTADIVEQLQSDLNKLSSDVNSNPANDCNEKFETTSSSLTALNKEIFKIGLDLDNLQEANKKSINQCQNDMKSVSVEIISKLESYSTEKSCSTSNPTPTPAPTTATTTSMTTAIDCPDETWSKYKDNCYHLLINKYNRTGCRQECVQLGGDLASIHSQEENEFVTSLIGARPAREGLSRSNGKAKNAWIGAKYSHSQDIFLWSDQSNWDFDNWNWQLSEPHKSKDSCVFIGYDLKNPEKWADGVCSWSSPFDCICKI